MGPATNSKKRTASKENENESAKGSKAQKVLADDQVSDRAGKKQTKKADRRRSFRVALEIANGIDTQPNLCRKNKQSNHYLTATTRRKEMVRTYHIPHP